MYSHCFDKDCMTLVDEYNAAYELVDYVEDSMMVVFILGSIFFLSIMILLCWSINLCAFKYCRGWYGPDTIYWVDVPEETKEIGGVSNTSTAA